MTCISPIIGLGNVSSLFMFFSIFHQFYVHECRVFICSILIKICSDSQVPMFPSSLFSFSFFVLQSFNYAIGQE